jgi:hypothetical protein
MFVVPGMKLIPQKNTSSCWYASVQMVVMWKRSTTKATLAGHPDASQVPQTVAWEVAANGLVNENVLRMAQLLGLRSVPPQSLSLAKIEDLLKRYGPLWTNGQDHIVVIAGADAGSDKVLVYDPWPPGKGEIKWKSYSGWYIGNDPKAKDEATRDTGEGVRAVFLYHP